MYSHGGLICTALRDFGVNNIISNCSVAGVIMKEKYDGDGGIKSL